MKIVDVKNADISQNPHKVDVRKIYDTKNAQAVTVVIHETELDNWGSAGEQHSVKFKDLKK